MIKEIELLSEEWGVGEQEVCYRFVAQGVMQSARERAEKNQSLTKAQASSTK